jgi:hypothetical protein
MNGSGETGKVFFLIGAERSGTTLLRIMLNAHPELSFKSEFEFAVDLVGDDGQWPSMERYREHLRLDRIFSMTGFALDDGLDYPTLVRGFLEQRRARDGKPRVGATVHRHFGRILHLWPDAGFIHIVRDGRDVARSRVREGWAGNAWDAAHEWVRVEEQIERLEREIGPGRMIHVRYESLVADAPSELTRICAFMGLEYAPAMLEFDRGSTYEKPDARASQRWKTKASPREVALIESVQGEMLERRGYELSGYRVVRPGPVGRRWLRLHSRAVCAGFRLKRYGPRVWIAEMVARRLGLKGMAGRVQLRINEIQRRHLK